MNNDKEITMAHSPVPYMDRSRRYYEVQGFDKPYVWAHFEEVPFTPLAKPLADSTLALLTTASLYARKPTDMRAVASGESATPPKRLFANDLSWDKKATHLDDLNSYFPISLLDDLVNTGCIGQLAQKFHCIPTEYSQRRTIEVDAPEILRRCREDAVDVAFLVPL